MAYTLAQSVERIRRLAADNSKDGPQRFTDEDIIAELRAALLETLGNNPRAFYSSGIYGMEDRICSLGDGFKPGQANPPIMPISTSRIPGIELRALSTLTIGDRKSGPVSRAELTAPVQDDGR